jgi:hypothetical protein
LKKKKGKGGASWQAALSQAIAAVQTGNLETNHPKTKAKNKKTKTVSPSSLSNQLQHATLRRLPPRSAPRRQVSWMQHRAFGIQGLATYVPIPRYLRVDKQTPPRSLVNP